MKYVIIIVATMLVLLGMIIRVVEVANGNYVFGFDQGLDYMAARSIAVEHKLTLIGAEAGAGFAGRPVFFTGRGIGIFWQCCFLYHPAIPTEPLSHSQYSVL